MKSVFVSGLFLLASLNLVQAQESRPLDDQPHIQPKNLPQPKEEPQQPKEEKHGESSSQDSQIRLEGPAKGTGDSSVQQMYPYDPHKSAKDVEVGRFYLKTRNYRAALDRFNEALLYKPRDAEATFFLAQTEEKVELYDRAYQNYRDYLAIIPEGQYAHESQDALKRLEPHLHKTGPAEQQGADARQLVQDGEASLATNDFESAHTSFVKALQIVPDDPVANFRLAESLQGLQRLDEARIFYRKYLILQPNGKMAADAKRQINEINFILGKEAKY
ncbi:MAG TPA: tetratricopeptide repeat protein [Candidatus Angelobacter sp.]